MVMTCVSCQQPLLVEVDTDSDVEDSKRGLTPDTIPDDVEMKCGCHFHWECFLDSDTITECTNCSKDISSLSATGQQQVLCIVKNEGGTEKDFDILPAATEEAYLRAYPEERRGHAFLQFCREGDVDAVLALIKDSDSEDVELEEEEQDILRYTGTFEGIEGSGLHVAVRYQREEVAWLLLALASNLDWSRFPPVVLQAMNSLGVSKADRKATPDIRTLLDEQSRTAAAVATEIGKPWTQWLIDGRLTP